MALKMPLVLYSGRVSQLQAGDTISGGGSGGTTTLGLMNGNAGALVIGTPVYVMGNDEVDKARANAVGTVDVIGVVQDVTVASGGTANVLLVGVLSATTAQWDAVTGGTGGLLANQRYWLSPTTAGMLTITPSATVGQYLVPVGLGVSTTELLLFLGEVVAL